MTATKSMQSLSRLVALREQEVDRLTADVAAKQALRERYLGNLERLERLCESTGASGALPPVLSMNCAAYKQAVMQLAASHRQDLALHEADMAVAQQALLAASRRHEVLDQVLVRQQDRRRQAQQTQEQKRQDELATQVWWRGQS